MWLFRESGMQPSAAPEDSVHRLLDKQVAAWNAGDA